MCDEKKVLQNDEAAKVVGGLTDPESAPLYVPYPHQEHFPVRCLKCGSNNIYWDGGFLGIEETIRYECQACKYTFSYNELPVHGASCDW